MEQKTKVANVNGKTTKLYERVCSQCGAKEWKKHRVISANHNLCKSCQLIFKGSISISNKVEHMEQDEELNRKMIQEWLSKNKPSVIDHKPIVHYAGIINI